MYKIFSPRKNCKKYNNIAAALLALVSMVLLLQSLIEMPLRVPRDYNEGWNAFQAARVLDRKKLYPKYTDLDANNYPPVSYYLIGSLGSLAGDNLIMGRIVALVSLFAVAVCIAAIIRLYGGSPQAAIIAAIFFVGYMAAWHPLYVALNDPQLLGHALILSGFVLFLMSGRKGILFYLSILVMVLAGLVKHSLIPLPLAITIWLFVYDRRAFAYWVAAAVILLGLAGTLLVSVYGDNFLHGLFLDARSYSRWRVARQITHWFTPMLPLLAMGVFGSVFLFRSPQGKLVLLYIVISLGWGTFLLGGKHVDQNAVFDAAIGLTIAAGLLLDRAHSAANTAPRETAQLATALVFVLLVSITVVLPERLYVTKAVIKNRARAAEIVYEDVRFIARQDGPAMCESLALCYWAGKGFEVDFFLTGQKIKVGVIDERALSDLIDQHYFAVIQIDSPEGRSFRLPVRVNNKIRDAYDARRISEKSGVLFVPRTQQIPES